jgi:hypothetical protein
MARKDRDMPTAPSAAIVDEQTKRAAMRTSTSTTTSPASVRRFEETGQGFAKPKTNTTTVSTTSPASVRKFEETDTGFTEPVVEPVVGWVKASTIQTASGPVDVDANGLAADGSTPTPITADDVAAEAAASKKIYDAEQAAIAKKAADEAEKRDAFATIQDTMRSYGFDEAELKELSTFIESNDTPIEVSEPEVPEVLEVPEVSEVVSEVSEEVSEVTKEPIEPVTLLSVTELPELPVLPIESIASCTPCAELIS